MLLPNVHITIGNLTFDYVHKVIVTSSWKEMTDTCEIQLPRNLRLAKDRLEELIKVGDTVIVQMGYDGELQPAFYGFVTRISPTIPITIKCEDEMWQLKKGSFTQSWESVTLNTVLKHILGRKPFDTLGAVNLGSFTMNKATPAKVLLDLKKVYGLRSFYRNGVLNVGKPYDPFSSTTHTLHFQKNVAGHTLEFRSKDELKLKVKAISILPDGSKIEHELGDSDGEERTLHFYNLQLDELKQMAEQEMARLKHDGFRGTIKSFGTPFVRHGDVVKLEGSSSGLLLGDEPVHDFVGAYYIDKVITESGVGGFRHEGTLGPIEEQAYIIAA